MNCNGFESELRSSIERRETADRLDLREHAARCARCGPLLEQQLLLERAVAAWKEHTPPVDLAERVMARWAFDRGLEDEGTVRPSADCGAPLTDRNGQPLVATPAVPAAARPAVRRLDRRLVVAAVVAILALLASPFVWRPGGPTDEGSPQIADDAQRDDTRQPQAVPSDVADAPVASVAPVAEGPVRLEAAVRDAGSAWLRLANDATGAVREMAAFLPDRTLAIAIESGDEASDWPGGGWTERLQDEVRPIGRDVGKAFDFLREAVPLGPAPAI